VLGPDVHVMAVCQPSVPLLAAVARMEVERDPRTPRSMILMGGPIDTRKSPTKVNEIAKERGIEWFRRHCIVKVPFNSPGFLREVYPGFLQLSGFMAMNMDRHMTAQGEMYKHLVEGDGDSAEKHREFYDEYLAVMDLTAEYYLQTVETNFVRHALAKGEMMHRDKHVDTTAIRRVALMTVEGEKDDISGVGQTEAAHGLCPNIPESLKVHHLQKNVGHYGVFNGSRFRAEIAPRIADFILNVEVEAGARRPRRVAAE
jgi:poly(3-hydroxybutyrate) depolymerase